MFDDTTTSDRDGLDGDREPALRADPYNAERAQKERFGGLNIGAGVFGWLVAVAVSVLLTGVLGAVVAALGASLPIAWADARQDLGTLTISASVALLVVLMLGYYCGGYVAGRMSRFSGVRQGLGVWLVGLVVTVVTVVLGLVFGSQYDVLARVSLPRLPVPTDTLTTGSIIALAAVLVGTLVAALVGGSVGTHYHRRVDRAGQGY